jgi:hypothetical protein
MMKICFFILNGALAILSSVYVFLLLVYQRKGLSMIFPSARLIFSSPELKAQVSYSDRLLSVVRPSVRL